MQLRPERDSKPRPTDVHAAVIGERLTKVVFHAGLNKTGSTSVQAALAANRERLAAEGFFYPRLDEGPIPGHWALNAFWRDQMRPETAGHLMRRLDRSGTPEDVLSEVRRSLVQTLRRAAAHPGGMVLLSDEHFGYPDAISGAQRLSALVSRHGGSLSVLAYARPDPALYPSFIQQQLKHIARRVSDNDQCHPGMIGCLRKGFGPERVAVRIYDPSVLVEGDAVADFCTWIVSHAGRLLPDVGRTPRLNVSIAAPGCALLLRLRDEADPARDELAFSSVRRLLMESFHALPAPRLMLPEGWERRIRSRAHTAWNAMLATVDHPEPVRDRFKMPALPPEQAFSPEELRNWIEAQWDPEYNSAFRAHLAKRQERWVGPALALLDRL